MGSIKNIVISVTITFILSLFLNYAITYFTQDNGTISISNQFSTNDGTYRIITIENASNNILHNIVFEVSSEIISNNLSSTEPVEIKFNENLPSSKYKYINISNVPPLKNTKIVVKNSNKDKSEYISSINYKNLGLSIADENSIESRSQKVFLNALLLATIYAFFIGIYSYVDYSHRKQLHLDQKDELSTIKKQLKDQLKYYEELRSANTKARLLTCSKLSDFSKELNFWRNTIKSLLVLEKDKINFDDLKNAVTEGLKTYGTRNECKAFDSVKFISGWLSEYDRLNKAGEASEA